MVTMNFLLDCYNYINTNMTTTPSLRSSVSTHYEINKVLVIIEINIGNDNLKSSCLLRNKFSGSKELQPTK